jgi:hypothetical protein
MIEDASALIVDLGTGSNRFPEFAPSEVRSSMGGALED